MSSKEIEQQWTTVITSDKKRFHLGIKEVLEYKDLMFLFFKRDFTAMYKQTILGPAWYLIQPLITTLVYSFVFGRLAGLGTDGIPSYLFYLSGIILWRLFSNILTSSSSTFSKNAGIFGKVYFPRLVSPLSEIGSQIVGYGLQMLMFVVIYVYYLTQGMIVKLHWSLMLLPLVLLQMILLALGLGLIVSSMTTKYRDLQFLVSFIMQLWMYASPVAYPLSELSGKLSGSISWIFWINPVAFPIELFRYMLFQSNTLDFNQGFVSLGITLLFFVFGAANFNRVERDFMDRI